MNWLSTWFRRRSEVIAASTVCLTLIGATFADSQIVHESAIQIGTNWRGLYDILVTAPNQTFGGTTTRGLVDPEFVSTAGQGGISLKQLAAIRKISGVEVAAPIGLVGEISDVDQTPQLILNDDPVGKRSDIPSGGEVLRLTTTLTRSTQEGQITLAQSRGVVQLAKRTVSEVSSPSGTPTAIGYPTGFSPQSNNLFYQVPMGTMPDLSNLVFAVDPKSEAELYGSKAVSYLHPLLGVPQQRTSANADEWAAIVNPHRYLVQQTAIQQAKANGDTSDRIVPLVVNASQTAQLTFSVSVQHEVDPQSAILSQEQLQDLLTKGVFGSTQILTRNVSDLTVPFSSPNLSVMLPGSTLPKGNSPGSFYGDSSGLDPLLIGRPVYTERAPLAASPSTPAYTVDPDGIVTVDGQSPDSTDPGSTGQILGVGNVQSYRTETTPRNGGATTALSAPVGQFTDAQLASPGRNSVSYVPSGIYDGSDTKRVSATDGQVSDQVVQANLSGVDFLTAAPGAFTDLAGGAELRGSTPIDAIRVRISGLTSYDARSRARVETVAEHVAKLGLRATVVAGSSLEPVDVYVPKYHLTSSGDTRDLGWVRQEWTSLGAAVTVTNALGAMQLALLLSTLGAVFLAFIGSLVVAARRRRPELEVMRTIGWTGPQLSRRVVGQQAPTVLLIVAAAIGCLFFGVGKSTAGLIDVIAIVTTFVAAGIAIGLALSHPKRRLARRSRTVKSLFALATRHSTAAPASSLAQLAGVVAVGASAALTYAAIRNGQTSAGATRLASLVLSSTLVAAVLLGVAGIVSAFILAFLGRRSELRRRSGEARVFAVVGYPRAAITRLYAFELLILGILALLISSAISIWLGGMLNGVSGVAPIGIGTTLVALFVLVVAVREGK